MTLPHGFAASADTPALPLHLVDREGFAAWRQQQPSSAWQWAQLHGFDGAPGTALVLPDGDGGFAGAVLGIGDPLDPYSYAHAPQALPGGDWQLAGAPEPAHRQALLLGWGLGA